MIRINQEMKPSNLKEKIRKFWEISGAKINLVERNFDSKQGAPVFTIKGKYSTRGWTEWTQGFQYGSALLQYDATGEKSFLEYGRRKTLKQMAPHVSHTGVHDHGFNNVSTYGNLLRLMKEKKTGYSEWEKNFYELALKISGAVQASRWTVIKEGGFIHSFNGPHSLFVDTLRSCRSLVISHMLGHTMQGEGDVRISLLERAIQHIRSTANFSIYYGEGRDCYDHWGRTAHESIFNIKDGNYRCPNSQQGFSGFTTWTRGLAWAMCGFAEELEWINGMDESTLDTPAGRKDLLELMLKAAKATCDFYIDHSCADGIPYWDTGAPSLFRMSDWTNKPADPYNQFEPVDSSAATIGAQGLLRLGNFLKNYGEPEMGNHYWQAGLTVLDTLLQEPYLGMDPNHEGLVLHSIYHRPNGWDYIPPGSQIPCGESSMWGDYHMREVVLYLQRIIDGENYYTFFNCVQ